MAEDTTVRDIHDIKNTLTKFSIRLGLVYDALVGNEITKDGGLVKEIVDQKAKIILLEQRIEEVETKEDKRQQLITTVWAIGSFLAATVLTLIVGHFLRN